MSENLLWWDEETEPVIECMTCFRLFRASDLDVDSGECQECLDLKQACIAGDDYGGLKAFDEVLPSRAAPSSGAGAIDGFIVDAGTHPAQAVDAELLPPPVDQQAKRAGSLKKPEAYSAPEVRSDCRSIRAALRAAAAFATKPDRHTLRLTDRELLHLHSALSHDRDKTRKAIGKGLAKYGDLHASDSAWQKLQAVYFGRITGRQS